MFSSVDCFWISREALMNLAKEGARKDSNGFDDIDDFFGDSDGGLSFFIIL
jgi:hypothetical protein